HGDAEFVREVDQVEDPSLVIEADADAVSLFIAAQTHSLLTFAQQVVRACRFLQCTFVGLPTTTTTLPARHNRPKGMPLPSPTTCTAFLPPFFQRICNFLLDLHSSIS